MVAPGFARRAWEALARGAKALRRDRRGTYIVEFALIFNVLLIVLLLTMETAFQMAIDMALTHGARTATRQTALGPSVSSPVTSQLGLVNRVLDSTGLPLRAWGTASITAEQFTSYTALAAAPQFGNNATGQKQCATTNTTSTTGVSGGVIRYCIIYQARAFTPYARLMLPSGGSLFTHRTFFVVQNEPY